MILTLLALGAFPSDPPASTDSALRALIDDVTEVRIHPARLELESPYDAAQLLVTGVLESGDTVDLTRSAELVEAPDCLALDERRLARPIADGVGTLVLRVADETLEVPVEVGGVASAETPLFTTDVMPVLAQLGCNAGTCHGSQAGQNGFQLSLRGYDPVFDHAALTDDLAGRRFDRVAPERSLFLRKLSGEVPHVGGQLAAPGDPNYELLRAWVEGGARFDATAPRVASIEVLPKDPVLPVPGLDQQFAVLATMTDGSRRDVTADAFLESGDLDVLSVEPGAMARTLRRGEAAVLVRYEGRYAASRVVVMGDRQGWEWPADEAGASLTGFNWIDDHVYAKLRAVRTSPADVCTDAEYLRRVRLDLTGRIPTPEEVRVFLLDERDSQTKRAELVDRLLGSPDYVEHWSNRWADLLQVNRKYLGERGADAWRRWIRTQVASNAPYDDFVREILTATGSTLETPAAAYWKVQREPGPSIETTTQLFLGVRFNCNKCHDHPFERWTRDQYWELAAFLGQVERKNAPGSKLMPRASVAEPDQKIAFEELISDAMEGEVEDPDLGGVVAPSFPYEHAGDVPADAPRRARLAAWMTAPENPYFASNYVNRLWGYLFGRGLIDPIDDTRAGNPPAIPSLLDALTADFVESGFDARHVLRQICLSRTYQHSLETSRWNEDDRLNFASAAARRLPAEVLFDALHQATGTPTALPGQRPGTRAAQLVDGSVKAPDGFLDLFGRPPRESACECERESGVSLGQALSLVNGPTVGDAIHAPGNEIESLVRYERQDSAVVDELYLRFLGRFPSESERQALAGTLDPLRRENLAALAPEAAASFHERMRALESDVQVANWLPLDAGDGHSEGGATVTALEDGSWRIDGANPDKDRVTLTLWTEATGLTGLRLEALSDEGLPAGGPGRAENGNFVLGELTVTAVPLKLPTEAKKVEFTQATASFSQQGWDVAGAIDGGPGKGWAVSPRFGETHEAVFEAKEDFGAEGGTLLIVTLDEPYGSQHTLGRLRLSVTSSPRPVRHHGLPDPVLEALATAEAERTDAHRDALHRHLVRKDEALIERIRLGAARDLAWALANSPAFLFNR